MYVCRLSSTTSLKRLDLAGCGAVVDAQDVVHAQEVVDAQEAGLALITCIMDMLKFATLGYSNSRRLRRTPP
jgi:hypothetical protein